MKRILLVLALLALASACSTPAPTNVPSIASAPERAAAPTARATDTTVPTRPPTQAPTPSPVCHTDATPLPTKTPPSEIRMLVPTPLPTPQLQPIAAHGQIVDTQFHSALLDRDLAITIYLPPGYRASTDRYPTLYMLSGFAGDHREWMNYGLCDAVEMLIRGGYVEPMILVLPEGDRSWWFNHATVTGSDGKPWGDYIWKDVVGYVDANYRTIPDPRERAVGGLSSGGQAAYMLALTHPEVFRIAGGHSPSTRHADGSLAIFGTPDYFNQYDPMWLFQHKTMNPPLALWMDVAAEDTEWGDADHQLHDLLTSLKIQHTFVDNWPGNHDGYYWGAHAVDYVLWYASQWQDP